MQTLKKTGENPGLIPGFFGPNVSCENQGWRGVNFRFQDRAQAGRLLADKLGAYAGRADVVVLGLPRGGIPVAFEVARRLQAPLAAFLVRKLGVPGHEELAMGAIASGGVCFLNAPVIEALDIPQRAIDGAVARERRELERREQVCRVAPMPELRDRVVILIDDGLATGASMRAAVIAVREHHPARVIVAAPVAAKETYHEFKREADEVVCVETPAGFQGVGQWYEDFSQTTDEEVRELLSQISNLKF
jgi:putative phosphoribosyl transferase